MKLLLDMLAYRRPHLSVTEELFIDKYLLPLPGARKDGFGNIIVQVGKSSMMWSSHTDTVHTKDGFQHLSQTKDGFVFTEEMSSNCLGADCTTGVWLMVEMIRAKVPGLYVFHRGEEKGGKGSAWIVQNTPEIVKGITACIAFDRMALDSVITFQAGDRCCSDDFANSLSDALDMTMTKDTGGTFTDSANYTDLIPECTNISVGYYKQHTYQEYQDLIFAETLLNALLAFDPTKLVVKRKAGDRESKWANYGYGHGYSALDGQYYYGQNRDIRELTALCRLNAVHLAKSLFAEGVTIDTLKQLVAKGKTLDNEGLPKADSLFDDEDLWNAA